ncbi:MAG: endonuclease/exonuclease/phosphatase family protein [Nocardioidaceae bacterium]
MGLGRVVATLGAAVAVLSLSLGPSLTAPVSAADSAGAYDVRVGTFNLSSVSFDFKAGGDHRTWRERRPAVVSQILQQRLDVVGLQEANQSIKYAGGLDFGANQYLDLKNALNRRGGNYALTNEAAYDCVKATSSYNCVYQDRNASQDNRIMYDTDRVSLVRQGSEKFRTQTPGKNERYLVWAVLRMKATGRTFFFTDTHLDPYSAATRKGQWQESIDMTNRLKDGHPVVAVGDYNTSKWDGYAATMLPKMRANGYGDVLNQQYAKNLAKPRAESVKRGWVNSFNGFRRDVRAYAYEDAKYKIGNSIDWIFVTNSVRVKQWSNVTAVDEKTNLTKGVIPSDHALVRATIVLD